MICITPTTIRNPDRTRGSKCTHIEVPCRKCVPCLKKRASQWVFRLKWENERSTTAAFLTYTYNPDSIPITQNGLQTLAPRDHTLFMKKFRKELKANNYVEQLKYYMCAEYGEKFKRPHYHAILFNVPKFYLENQHKIQKIWGKGKIQVDLVTPASIAYVCGYVNKQKFFTSSDPSDDRLPEYSRMSKNMGSNFLTPQRIKYLKQHLKPTLKVENGVVIALPEYYKRKALTPEEQKIISLKSIAYAEKNPTFETHKAHHDYVKQSGQHRLRMSKNARNLNQ